MRNEEKTSLLIGQLERDSKGNGESQRELCSSATRDLSERAILHEESRESDNASCRFLLVSRRRGRPVNRTHLSELMMGGGEAEMRCALMHDRLEDIYTESEWETSEIRKSSENGTL